jgi:hypothetical protein
MNRMLLGALAALLLVAAGVFWWQGRAEVAVGAPPPQLADSAAAPHALPSADVGDLRGPAPPEAAELSREQRRFARYDHDSDGRITRNEMMATRTRAFRELDKDGNNLLTFEEWAVSTSDRFRKADANGDLWLNREEFATTRPPERPKPKCRC